MTTDMWYAIIILIIAIIFFVTEWIRVDVVALSVVAALMITNLLTVSEAFAGFSNSAVLTIAALFIVGGAVLNTGLAELIGERILKIAGSDERRLIAVIMLAVGALSGFMSSTGTVAVLMPAIITLSRKIKISPSKLLIPLSFASLLGGALTLIGTPPNIIVRDAIIEANLERGTNAQLEVFEFFSYAPVGVLLLITGIGFMLLIGHYLLPEHTEPEEREATENPEKLIEHYQLTDKLAYLRVERNSTINGRTIAECEIRQEFDVTIIEIIRPPGSRQVASIGGQRLMLQPNESEYIFPEPDTRFNTEDIVIIQGNVAAVRRFAYTAKLSFEDKSIDTKEAFINRRIGIAEVILGPRSPLVGKTLDQTRFGSTYNLSVLRINRPDNEQNIDINATELHFGDTLLVQGLWPNINALRHNRQDFVVIAGAQAVKQTNFAKAGITFIILVGMVLLMVTNIVPVATASLLGALAVILTGCLTMDDAYDAIDWKSIVLIAGMLPMATALEKVGLIEDVAQLVTDSLGDRGPLIVMGGLFLLTTILTQVLSNTTTTVLLAPIALATAIRLDIEPYAFLMTVSIAASMAFASPVASPTNTLVLGAGQYKFADFAKIGIPMILLMMAVTMLIVPIIFPFN